MRAALAVGVVVGAAAANAATDDGDLAKFVRPHVSLPALAVYESL